MERVQESALRFVFDDKSTSYEIICERAGVSTLTLSRIKSIAAEVFKATQARIIKFLGLRAEVPIS